MVELSEDESGITPRIEYWREKDSILGSCGFHCDGHKCNDHFYPKIGDSWDRLVEIMRRSVASTYLRVIMCNPLNDWLPPMVCFVSATCNKFDHVPHVTSQWDITLAEFNRVLKPLGCNHTGRGSDGDGRRTKLQHELADKAAKKLNVLTAAALVLQHRWRRPTNVVYVVCQLLRRRVTGTVLVRISLTFTMPISLSAHGFTFVAMATYDTQSGAMLSITNLSSQDPKHKGKRLDMPLQSSAKTMLIDNYCASAIDLFLVRNYFDDEQVRNLRTSDLRRDDRQNFAAVVRRSGKLVIGILIILQQPAHGGHRTQGTVAVYRMISKYLLIFFSQVIFGGTCA